MRALSRLFALTLVLAAASLSLPALAQPKHEMKGKIVRLDADAKHLVVEETHGRKYRQPLAVGSGSQILLPGGAGTLAQVHVGDEVVVRYHASATGPEVEELRVTKPAPN